MQLQLTLSGVLHSVALLHLTRPAVKRLQERRPDDWRVHLCQTAVGPKRSQLLPAFIESGGYKPLVNQLRRGMHLQAKHFGIEAVVDGLEQIPEAVGSEQREMPLTKLLRGFGEDDLLGVFQLSAQGTMHHHWQAEGSFDSRRLRLLLENTGPAINAEDRFDLITNVTYRDVSPDSRSFEGVGKPLMLKPIFHVPRKG